MIRKTKLIKTLDDLPEEFSIDELVDRLIIIQKVEEAQKQSQEGLKYSEDQAKSMIKKWSK
ncbi:hypothetical protein RCC89_03280 [Cytophagaceae bacterium ABcell3]|nr:hypothetical protein RCC89_03280 [Cytophagaceae bacterium ABcell3]